jgi:hypothetical protein
MTFVDGKGSTQYGPIFGNRCLFPILLYMLVLLNPYKTVSGGMWHKNACELWGLIFSS